MDRTCSSTQEARSTGMLISSWRPKDAGQVKAEDKCQYCVTFVLPLCLIQIQIPK